MNGQVEITEEETLFEQPRDREGRNILRITKAKANGFPFIGVREWFRDETGELRPGKKGISIKMRELAGVIDALEKAR